MLTHTTDECSFFGGAIGDARSMEMFILVKVKFRMFIVKGDANSRQMDL